MDPADARTHVTGFRIDITPKTRDEQGNAVLTNGNGDVVSATTLTVEYHTIVDDAALEEGGAWTIANHAEVGSHSADASYTHRKEKPFAKMTGTRPDWGGDVSYQDADAKVDYDASKGVLYYQLLLRTDKNTTGDLTVTDVLPEGAKLVAEGENAPQAVFWHNEYWTTTSIESWDNGTLRRYDLTDGTTFTHRVVSGSDGPDTVLFSIKDGYNLDGNANVIAIRYALDVTGDPYWNDASHASHTYRNHASWNGRSDETATEVMHTVETLTKRGEQLRGEDGKPSDRVRYTITVNPAGADLDKTSDMLTLTDVMSGVPSSGGAYLDLASLGLYEYGGRQDASGRPSLGEPIDTSRYTVRYDQNTHTLTVRLPDAQACVLAYEYVVDAGNVDRPQLSNHAELNGVTSSGTNIAIETSSSSAAVWRGRLTVYKVDADNYAKTLAGAEFTISAYERAEDGSRRWGEPMAMRTDENGSLVLSVVNRTAEAPACDASGDGADHAATHCQLRPDTLYRLTETKAPEGYAKDGTPRYLIWKSMTAGVAVSDEEAYQRATGGDDAVADGETSVGRQQVAFHRANGDEPLYVENRYTRVAVRKSWVNGEGHTVASPQDSILAQLYRVGTKANGHQVDVTLVAQGVSESEYAVKASLLAKPGSALSVVVSGSWSGVTYEGASYMPDYANEGRITIPLGSVDASRRITLTLNDAWDRAATVRFDGTASDEYVIDGEAAPYGEPVELNAGNDWSAVWDDLPQADAAGAPYRYSVRELDSDYEVSYVNNDGITHGEIGIVNTVSGTPLPETGGAGTTALTVAGGAMTFAALGAFAVRSATSVPSARSSRRRARR